MSTGLLGYHSVSASAKRKKKELDGFIWCNSAICSNKGNSKVLLWWYPFCAVIWQWLHLKTCYFLFFVVPLKPKTTANHGCGFIYLFFCCSGCDLPVKVELWHESGSTVGQFTERVRGTGKHRLYCRRWSPNAGQYHPVSSSAWVSALCVHVCVCHMGT